MSPPSVVKGAARGCFSGTAAPTVPAYKSSRCVTSGQTALGSTMTEGLSGSAGAPTGWALRHERALAPALQAACRRGGFIR